MNHDSEIRQSQLETLLSNPRPHQASILRFCVCIYVNLQFLYWRGTILQLELPFDLSKLNKYFGLSAKGYPSGS